MGLDIIYEPSYGQSRYAFRAGSYSGFHEFRNLLSQVSDDEKLFFALLDHSDCDGFLSQTECIALHVDFCENRGAFERMLENLGEEERKWEMDIYDKWTEWIGACAKHGGQLVFA